MDWERITEELEKPLNSENVKKPTGRYGPKGDYIEGWHAIAEANRVFGFGGWSQTILSLTEHTLNEVQRDGKTQWVAAFTCQIEVRVGDIVRQDVGFGSGFAANIGDAVEGATKEAVTDALKRALRTFGNIFGLALYDKSRANVSDGEADASREEPKAESAASSPARDPDTVTKWLVDHLRKVETYANLKTLIASGKSSEAIKWLGEEHQSHSQTVDEAITAAWRRVDPAGQSPDPRVAANAAKDWGAA